MFKGIDFSLIESFYDSDEGFTDYCTECYQEILLCDCVRIFANEFKLDWEDYNA